MELKTYLCIILSGLRKIQDIPDEIKNDILQTLSSVDSYKDQNRFSFYYAFAAPGLEFQDIYPPGRTLITFPEEPSTTSSYDDFSLSSITTRFLKIHPQTLKIQPVSSTSTIVLNSSHVKSYQTSTTIKELKNMPLNEIPMEEMQTKEVPKRHYQRGVLDVLLPATRVRTFKKVFNTIKRMLSNTFKKR